MSRTDLKRDLLFIAVLALIVGAWFLLPRTPQTFIVTRTAAGFEPASLTIHTGDTVVFRSTSGKPYWPASDFHPAHLLYPEFDPLRPVPADEEWSFTFARAGTWTYHDHLDHLVHGTVIAVGTPGEDVANCLASSTSSVKAYCWAGLFTTIIRTEGLSAAFDRFAKLYAGNPVFVQNCHDIMHIIGKAAYDEFEKDGTQVFRPETSYCAYGFYHGFIEEMFAVSGSTDLGDGVRYCQALRTSPAFPSASAASSAAAACFHGLGHASLDSEDGSLFGDDGRMVRAALSQCEAFVPAADQPQCASGVFNSLANAYSGHDYELSFRDPDPTSICRVQKSAYQWSCYGEITIGYIRHKKYDFASAVRFIDALSAHRGDAIYDFIDDYIRHDMDNPTSQSTEALCGAFPADEQASCVRSVVHAFVTTGEPGNELARAVPFCKSFPEGGALRHGCFAGIGIELSVIKTDAETRSICDGYSPSDAAACRGQ